MGFYFPPQIPSVDDSVRSELLTPDEASRYLQGEERPRIQGLTRAPIALCVPQKGVRIQQTLINSFSIHDKKANVYMKDRPMLIDLTRTTRQEVHQRRRYIRPMCMLIVHYSAGTLLYGQSDAVLVFGVLHA